MDDTLSIRDALQRYYTAHGLPVDGGASAAFFVIHLGPLRLPAPNPPMRKHALLYHDINHLVTGYNTVFSEGEMIIAGYEIGAGCGRFAIAWIINLWMLALGLFIMPRRMFAAFVRGRRGQSLYRLGDQFGRDRLMDMTVGQLKQMLVLDDARDHSTPRAAPADRASFILWACVSWVALLGSAAIVLAAAWSIIAAVRWAISS